MAQLTQNFYAGAGDGFINNSDASNTSWANSRADTTGNLANVSATQENMYTRGTAGTFSIRRMFFPIDTSVIPANATIISAVFNFYYEGATWSLGSNQCNFALVGTSQASTSTLSNSDFPSMGTTRFCDTDIANNSAAGWKAMILNTAGLAAITKAGFTKIGIRSTNDFSDSTVPDNYSGGNIRFSRYSGTTSDPYLTVVYEAPLTLGEYNGAGSGITKLLMHLNGSSADSSGNNNNGTDTSITYSQANGKFGVGAGVVRASSSGIVWSTSSPDITPGSRTISAWFNLASLPASGEYYFINSISKYATGLVYYNDSGTKKAFLYHTDSGGSPTSSIPATGENLSTGVWYNLIGVYTAGTNVKTYLNGIEIHSQTITSTHSSGTGDSSIGKWTGAAHYFNGAIDEVIIENVAWSAEKVKKYFSFSKGRFGII